MTEPVFMSEQSQVFNRGGGANFRRAEDWERLTRLEFIVEDVLKESERQAEELKTVVMTQQEMLANLKTIKWVVVGGTVGYMLSAIGLEKAVTLFTRLSALLVI